MNKKVAKSLQNTLSRCGLKVADIGPTFQSDHLKIDGEIYGSALDHVFTVPKNNQSLCGLIANLNLNLNLNSIQFLIVQI